MYTLIYGREEIFYLHMKVYIKKKTGAKKIKSKIKNLNQ